MIDGPDIERRGAIHSTKISGNFGLKLNGSVRSNRKSFEKTGPPFEVVLFSRSDRSECWLNGSRPRFLEEKAEIVRGFLQEREIVDRAHEDEKNDMLLAFEVERENMRKAFECEKEEM